MFEAPARAPERVVWSVAGLVQAVAEALAAGFPSCTVRGELCGFSRAASGHCYFTLKDADGAPGTIRCVLFRRAAGLLSFAPAEGQQVEVRGRLGLYEPRGELQLVVESMQRAGAGAEHERFLRLKAKLEAEGLFDASRKRPIAAHPRRVGVVTSLDAAALRDVATTFARRAPHVAVIVYPSTVQGAESPSALCDAIAIAGRRAEVDTLIVARGGGSAQDLWAFNDEAVVRAIAAAPMPVICGVGHETDVTLADFAADLRAATPTAAAELAAPAARACREALAASQALLRRRVESALDRHAQRLDRTAARLARPGDSVQRHHRRLDALAHRLAAGAGRELAAGRARHGALELRWQRSIAASRDRWARRLGLLAARLEAVDPRAVLARGYAWLTDAGGHAVVSIADVRTGAALRATLADGTADVRVTGVERDVDRDAGA